MAKKTKNLQKNLQLDEGDIWVSSISGAPVFTAPEINAALISKQLENQYICGGINNMQRVIFQEAVVVTGVNAKTNEPDPDLTEKLETLLKRLDFNTFLQMRWRDVISWGISIVNPVWKQIESEYQLEKIRRLPPETFSANATSTTVANRILPGICYNNGETEYWQTNSDGEIQQLHNIDVQTDPISTEIGGTPFILPLIPIISALSFAWQKNLAQVNIFGTGGIHYIRVINPKGNDKQYAQAILNNESATNRYQLRENMEVVSLGDGPTGTALDTISSLTTLIKYFFSPISSILKEGSQIIGGSSSSEYQLYMSFIKGQHRWLEQSSEQLLQPYLEYNGYANHKIVVDIPAPTVEDKEYNLKAAELGAKYGGITANEFRSYLHLELLEGDEGNEMIKPGTSISAAEKADIMNKFIHPIDPYAIINKKQQQKFVQKVLSDAF